MAEPLLYYKDPPPTGIHPLSLHDALPIWHGSASASGKTERTARPNGGPMEVRCDGHTTVDPNAVGDRKSTRLNSSHPSISYAVFCLKKKTCACQGSAYQHVSSDAPCDLPT